MNTSKISDKVTELDSALVAAARKIRILSALRWPLQAERRFLEGWRSGRPALPEVHLEPQDHSHATAILEALQARCDRADPLQNLVYRTAGSYAAAGRMLGAIGTREFTRHSIELYGKPDDAYSTQDFTALDAAGFFLDTTDALLGSHAMAPAPTDLSAAQFAALLQREVDGFFDEDPITVVLDPELPSKAIAGSKRIRIRADALFSRLDLGQLLVHEAQTHVATLLNGKRQTGLKLLALGAPRTTRTQEGIAVLGELVTMSLDVIRLRRIALRIRAIAMALDGADFVDVFRSFLEGGQSEEEGYQSTVRCFRGADVRGGTAFTKDTVYLKGMLETYGFLATCIHENRPELARLLFAGRLSLGDAVELAPYFESGLIAEPHYVPRWATDLRTVASAFACNAYFTRIDLGEVKLDNFTRFEDVQAGTAGR